MKTTSWAMALAALIFAVPSHAQTYPTKPVKVILPFGPGSATDFVSRTLTEELTKELGAAFVIDYKPGASGQIGAVAAAKSPPDGYTLFVGTNSTQAGNVYLFKDLKYDPIKDFEPISYLVSYTSVIAVHPSTPVSNVTELIAYTKANPGKVSYTYGNVISQVVFSTLFRIGGVKDVIAVPYKSNPQGAAEVMAGRATMAMVDLASSGALLVSGKLKPIAGARGQRPKTMPHIPAVAETPGFQGFDIRSWVGLFAPAHTPKAVVTTLNAATRKRLMTNEVQERFKSVSADLEPGTPEELRAHVARQVDVWAKLLRDAGIERQ